MSYIPKIVGADEKLIGIARLHWIYLAKGLFAFALCTVFGYLLNLGIGYGLNFLYYGSVAPTTSVALSTITVYNYIMPLMMGAGFFIFLCYLVKVMGSEVGLTTQRVIHKEGLFFIKVHEVDIEEIRGASMDLGYFGGILGYAYLQFDCRFVGDVRTPAIENPERFIKAMHKMRADNTDSLTAAEMSAEEVQHAPVQTPGLRPDPVIQPMPTEIPEMPSTRVQAQQQPPQPTQPPAPPLETPAQPTPPEIPNAPPVQTPPPPQSPPPADPAQPPAQAKALDAAMVAQIIDQVMPQMVEKIADELAAKGIIHEQDQEGHVSEEELLSSFDEASRKPGDGKTTH